MNLFKSVCASAALMFLGAGFSLQAQTADAPDGPFPQKKADADARAQAIEARRRAEREYLEERAQSAAAALQALTTPPGKAAIPQALLTTAQGLYLFEQWQAGHLITTEVCAGLGAARCGAAWSRAVFYRAFDLGNGKGLKAGTREARRIVLVCVSPKALAWMALARWNFAEVRAQGAKILTGPRGELPKDFNPLAADIWVYDDSATDLPAGSDYPGGGTILDNPWATQAAYETPDLPDTGALLRQNGAHSPEWMAHFWNALQKAAP